MWKRRRKGGEVSFPRVRDTHVVVRLSPLPLFLLSRLKNEVLKPSSPPPPSAPQLRILLAFLFLPFLSPKFSTMVIFCIEERRARKKEKFHCLEKEGREKKVIFAMVPSFPPSRLPHSLSRAEGGGVHSRPPASKKGKKKRPKSPVLFGGGRATPALFPSPLHPSSAVEEDCRSRTLLRRGCFHFSPQPAGPPKGCAEEGVLLSAHPSLLLRAFTLDQPATSPGKYPAAAAAARAGVVMRLLLLLPLARYVRPLAPSFLPPALPPPVIVASFPVPAASASSSHSFHGSRCSMALQKQEAR